jgi:hypothetical protein
MHYHWTNGQKNRSFGYWSLPYTLPHLYLFHTFLCWSSFDMLYICLPISFVVPVNYLWRFVWLLLGCGTKEAELHD